MRWLALLQSILQRRAQRGWENDREGKKKEESERPYTPAYSIDDLQQTSHLPRSVFCPITNFPMSDPVVTEDGFSYERAAIEHWFRYKHTSPTTGGVLASARVLPNHALRTTIHELIHTPA